MARNSAMNAPQQNTPQILLANAIAQERLRLQTVREVSAAELESVQRALRSIDERIAALATLADLYPISEVEPPAEILPIAKVIEFKPVAFGPAFTYEPGVFPVEIEPAPAMEGQQQAFPAAAEVIEPVQVPEPVMEPVEAPLPKLVVEAVETPAIDLPRKIPHGGVANSRAFRKVVDRADQSADMAAIEAFLKANGGPNKQPAAYVGFSSGSISAEDRAKVDTHTEKLAAEEAARRSKRR